MKLFNFKIPTGEEKEITAIETWVVRWKSMYYGTSNFADVKTSSQSFPDKETAIEFKKQLEQAHNLLRNTYHNTVEIEKDMPLKK